MTSIRRTGASVGALLLIGWSALWFDGTTTTIRFQVEATGTPVRTWYEGSECDGSEGESLQMPTRVVLSTDDGRLQNLVMDGMLRDGDDYRPSVWGGNRGPVDTVEWTDALPDYTWDPADWNMNQIDVTIASTVLTMGVNGTRSTGSITQAIGANDVLVAAP